MIWALTFVACIIVFSPRIIAYLVPGWVGLAVIGLVYFWPHMPDLSRSAVIWSIGFLIAAFLFAIVARLVLGIPVAGGMIGCVVLAICYYGVTTIDKLWHAATHAVTSAVGAITLAHWTIAGVMVAALILVECWKAWRRAYPLLVDDDDDDWDDDPTDTPPMMPPAPPRISRAERKAAAIYAEIERKAKVSAEWEAWYSGRGPRPF